MAVMIVAAIVGLVVTVFWCLMITASRSDMAARRLLRKNRAATTQEFTV